MSAITLPPEIALVLGPLKEATELRDLEGQLIGTFVPNVVNGSEKLRCPFDENDLIEAEKILADDSHDWQPLQEVWRQIKGKGNAE